MASTERVKLSLTFGRRQLMFSREILVAARLPLGRFNNITIVVWIQLQVLMQLGVPIYHEPRELVHLLRCVQ